MGLGCYGRGVAARQLARAASVDRVFECRKRMYQPKRDHSASYAEIGLVLLSVVFAR